MPPPAAPNNSPLPTARRRARSCSSNNVVLEVQFGEIAEELVGRGIIAALTVINSLEANEQVLYARMINVEETTLIS